MPSVSNERYAKMDTTPLGSGGMGEVWRVYDNETAAVFVMKQLHSHLARGKDVERFRREMENLSAIRSPNVVRIVCTLANTDQPAYVMEYCPAGDLDKWLTGSRTLRDKLGAFVQVLDGLVVVHWRCLHRDIKPTNILLGQDGKFKLSDFGLSIAFDDARRVTTSNWYSTGFSPPEQLVDMASVTKAGDLYSMGAVLYYMFAGNVYRQPTDVECALIPHSLRPYLLWLLDSSPTRRCADAGNAADVIEVLIDNLEATDISSCPKCNGPMWVNVKHRDEYWHDLCLVCDYEKRY